MQIEYISVSRAGTWEECKYRYRYRYHLKVPSPEEEPYYFEYGKIVHAIAEHYVLEQGKKPLTEISRAILRGEVEIEDGVTVKNKVPPSYLKRLTGHLRSIEVLTKQIGFKGDVERPFFLDLDPPNEIMAKGVIDRLIPKDYNYFIIDYKTTKKGKWRKTPLSIKKDLQLRIYTWAVHRILNVPIDKIKSALYYVEGGNLIPVVFSQQSVEQAVTELIKTYHDIKNTDPNKVLGNVGDHCGRCDYRNICPFVRTTK
jgi:ATP-dependent exoDNAse (exonuclease V) beta subunit